MTLLGRIAVTLSDDPRYVAGQSYDVVLSTPQTPDPATLLTGTVGTPADGGVGAADGGEAAAAGDGTPA